MGRVVLAMLVIGLLTMAGCGDGDTPAGTAAAVTTTPTSAVPDIASQERAFMETFYPAAAQFADFQQSPPRDLGVAYDQITKMIAPWQEASAPSERTSEILTRWLAMAGGWQKVFELAKSGQTEAATAAAQAMDVGEAHSLGELIGATMAALGMALPATPTS